MTPYRHQQVYFWSSVMALAAGGMVLYLCAYQPQSWTGPKVAGVALFAILFTQLSIGAMTSLVGFLQLRRPFTSSTSCSDAGNDATTPPDVRTAIIIPIYHEDPARVFLGIRRMWDSLIRSGQDRHFDIFVLSDSEKPNAWIEEEKQWLDLCRDIREAGRIYYRRRRRAIHQKSGNVADFCRRWGKQYRYMIVLDADSIMSASALASLVAEMELNPAIGIIQTLPRQALGQTLFARAQQFGNWMHSRMFAAGSRYWHHLTGPYWGHNAIIRVAPFMEYCALPEIPPLGPFQGRFLSHDSVEAAFMRRLGYGIWLDYDLGGSYEEGPPDVKTALRRDRRWCRGNLQHIALLSARGLLWESRVLLLLGIMAYLSAPLWLLLIFITVGGREGGGSGRMGHPCAVALFGIVICLLFLPKGLALLLARPSVKSKPSKLFRSVLLETLLSILLAPIQMVSHTYSVIAAVASFPTRWSGQDRKGQEGGWNDSVRAFGGHTFLGLVGWWLTWRWHPGALPWMLPVLAGLVFSIPLSRWLSSEQLGARARRGGLLVIPEEANSPPELLGLNARTNDRTGGIFESEPYKAHRGLLQVVLDPYVCATHLVLLRSRPEVPDGQNASLADQLLIKGPDSLSPQEELAILGNAQMVNDLHRRVWTSRPGEVASWWLEVLRLYNEEKAMGTSR